MIASAAAIAPDADMLEGGCRCGRLRYRMQGPPIVTNCCHCRDCQRLTGSAFAVNAMIETARIEELGGAWSERDVQRDKNGTRSWRCAECSVLLFAEHRLFGDTMRFLRAGTLDEGDRVVPDAHFFVRSKHPWVAIPEGVPALDTLPEGELGLSLDPPRQDRLDAAMPPRD